MLRIVKILMEYGFDFQYKNLGIGIDKITSSKIDLNIFTQNGKIYYSISSTMDVIDDSENSYNFLENEVKKECVNKSKKN